MADDPSGVAPVVARERMPGNTEDALTNAVARNAAVVLSLPSAGMLRHYKSRFLSETAVGVWLESVPTERALINELITAGTPCAVSFKLGERKVSFAGRVVELNDQFVVNESVTLPAILLERPPEVKAVQRRTNYRVRVPENFDLKLQIWRLPPHAYLGDRPPRAAELAVVLNDISVGGIGIAVCPKDNEAPKVSEGERVRVLLSGGGRDDLLLEGRIRSIRPTPEGSLTTGVQFTKLQDALEGRRITSELTKIVGALQFDEVRRRRAACA